MRLTQYIRESVTDIEYAIENIKKKSAPYFKAAGPNGDFLYRGSKSYYLSDKRSVIKTKSRTDRQPLDTDKSLHELLDELFLEYKGWRARSEGVFVTSNRSSAHAYGKVFIMFPIGSFKFLYNPDVVDLTNRLNELYIYSRVMGEPEKYEKLLKVIKGYTNKNLTTATDKDVEIMIKCKEYFLVDDMNKPLLKELEKLF